MIEGRIKINTIETDSIVKYVKNTYTYKGVSFVFEYWCDGVSITSIDGSDIFERSVFKSPKDYLDLYSHIYEEAKISLLGNKTLIMTVFLNDKADYYVYAKDEKYIKNQD